MTAVRAQAALIPAVVYEKDKDTTSIAAVKGALNRFYQNPNQTTYDGVIRVYRVYSGSFNSGKQFAAQFMSLRSTISVLSQALRDKLDIEGW